MNQLKMDVLSKGFVGQEKLICNPSGKDKSSCGPDKSDGGFLGQISVVLVCCSDMDLQLWIDTEYSSECPFCL